MKNVNELRRKSVLKFILIAGFSFILFSGCQKELDEVTVHPEIAVPLLQSATTIRDIFTASQDSLALKVGPGGDMTLVYSGILHNKNASEIFPNIKDLLAPIPDTTNVLAIKLWNNIILKKAYATSGSILFGYQSEYPANLKLTIDLPDFKKGGIPLSISTDIIWTGSTSSGITFPVDLKDYQIQLPNDSLHINYTAVDGNGNHVKLTTLYGLIQGLTFSYAEGFWGVEEFDIVRDTIDLNIYKTQLKGNIEFDDPKVIAYIENSLGFPSRSKVNVMRVETEKGNTYDFNSPQLTQGVDFDYPPISDAGQSRTTKFVFDQTNSNIKQILNEYPIRLDYDIDAVANPDNNPDIIGFITDSSYFRVRLQVELPLKGKAFGFTTEKAYDLEIGSLQQMDSATLKIVTENELPAGVEVQMYLLDAQMNILDSLFGIDKQLIEAAPINSDGISNGFASKTSYISFPATRIQRLQNSRFVRVQASFSTTGNGVKTVQFLDKNAIRVRMGLKARIKEKLTK